MALPFPSDRFSTLTLICTTCRGCSGFGGASVGCSAVPDIATVLGRESQGRGDARVAATLQYLAANLSRTVRISALASRVGLSVSTLGRLFRRETGRSLRQYVREKRLEQAALRLAATDESISEIAYASGWNDLSNFHHAFRRVYGVSPMTFREVARNRR